MNCLSFDVPRIRKTHLGACFTYEIEDQHTFFGYSEAWIYDVVCEIMPVFWRCLLFNSTISNYIRYYMLFYHIVRRKSVYLVYLNR